MNEHRWQNQEPPWKAFPSFGPDMLPAKQGAEEQWYDEVWRPFWGALSPDERESYLAFWNASDEWRAALDFFFSQPVDFDLESDVRESERYLQQWRAAKHSKKPLWRRILRRFRS